ncbi:MAG: DNA adenine methylase [Verrucomicrobiia bacterium]|jgi:adenine-specific DNA methylase
MMDFESKQPMPMTFQELKAFPSTRYQGSKRKIVPWLRNCLQELDFTTALDVFGGTGSVSYLFKKMGKAVTYNDKLHFNHQVGLALIENDGVTLSPEDIASVISGRLETTPRFVRDTFKGIYFTDRENARIDSCVARINRLHAKRGALVYKRALLFYTLIQCCLIKRPFNLFHRRNLYLRFADVEREFGNKVTWDLPFNRHFTRFSSEVNELVFKGRRRCRSIRYDALAIPKGSYDLVYIDPPYLTKDASNESADYFRCYHFLEGLCRYDVWGDLIDYETPNLRMKPEGSNPWTDRDRNAEAFDSLFEKFADSIIVISYKKFGVPSIDTLVRMLKRHGKRVRTHSQHYKYALNHQNGEAQLNREVLLVAQ